MSISHTEAGQHSDVTIGRRVRLFYGISPNSHFKRADDTFLCIQFGAHIRDHSIQIGDFIILRLFAWSLCVINEKKKTVELSTQARR